MAQSLATKLGIKPNFHLLLINAPETYRAELDPLPEGAQVHLDDDGQYDVVQLFAKTKSELAQHVEAAKSAVKPAGCLWISFPKGNSKIQTDLTRDVGWDVIESTGWHSLLLISINDIWSGWKYRSVAAGRDGEGVRVMRK